MQKDKLDRKTRDINPRATKLHYKDNLLKIQKSAKEMEPPHEYLGY